MAGDPLLVRVGVRYFARLSETLGPVDVGDGVHFLNPEERAALKKIERGAIIRAAIAGALSTAVAAAIEVIYANPILGHRPRLATFEQNLHFWLIVGGATIVTSIIEIAYLYLDGLRAVYQLSRAAGLDLFPNQDDDKALAGAMARAALELPNPTGQLFGVNPLREASKTRLLVASLVYKAKISVTNFAIKALVRRSLGRAFVRSWLPFVAVPFTALWNGFVCWLIIREARVRAMGPSAAHEMIGLVFDGAPELSSEGRTAVVRAVASSIVRTEDLHPNLVALLKEIIAKVGMAPRGDASTDAEPGLDDSQIFLKRLAALPVVEQHIVLRVLAVSSIIDGRLTRAESRLLGEAWSACKVPEKRDAVEALRRSFLAGDAVSREQIAAV